MNDFYLSSVLFSPFICIFLNGIHFHVHVRPNHEFFPGSFLFPVPLPLPQPVNIPTAIVTASTAVIIFSYDCPPFTLFSCLSARCLRFHFRQTMPYLPWHFLLSSCLSCTCCHSYLPTYSPVLAAMPVPSKTHRCLFYCLHFLPLQTNPARMLPVPAVLPGIQ